MGLQHRAGNRSQDLKMHAPAMAQGPDIVEARHCCESALGCSPIVCARLSFHVSSCPSCWGFWSCVISLPKLTFFFLPQTSTHLGGTLPRCLFPIPKPCQQSAPTWGWLRRCRNAILRSIWLPFAASSSQACCPLSCASTPGLWDRAPRATGQTRLGKLSCLCGR